MIRNWHNQNQSFAPETKMGNDQNYDAVIGAAEGHTRKIPEAKFELAIIQVKFNQGSLFERTMVSLVLKS